MHEVVSAKIRLERSAHGPRYLEEASEADRKESYHDTMDLGPSLRFPIQEAGTVGTRRVNLGMMAAAKEFPACFEATFGGPPLLAARLGMMWSTHSRFALEKRLTVEDTVARAAYGKIFAGPLV